MPKAIRLNGNDFLNSYNCIRLSLPRQTINDKCPENVEIIRLYSQFCMFFSNLSEINLKKKMLTEIIFTPL